MIVSLKGGEPEESVTFTPGQVLNLGSKLYRTPYADMAQRAGLTLSEAVERRYKLVHEELSTHPTEALREEARKLGKPEGEEGSLERSEWFADWVENMPEEKDEGTDFSSIMAGLGRGKCDLSSNSDKDEEKSDEKYTWTQEGEDVQITFKLEPKDERKLTKNDMKVTFQSTSLKVVVAGDCLLDGTLAGRVDVDQCTWTLNGTDELQVALTKVNSKEEWDTLIKS